MKILKNMDPSKALHASTTIAGVLFLLVTFVLAQQLGISTGVFWAILSGTIAGMLIGKVTEYYTSLFLESAVARWTLGGPHTEKHGQKPWQLDEKISIHYNTGHLALMYWGFNVGLSEGRRVAARLGGAVRSTQPKLNDIVPRSSTSR